MARRLLRAGCGELMLAAHDKGDNLEASGRGWRILEGREPFKKLTIPSHGLSLHRHSCGCSISLANMHGRILQLLAKKHIGH